MILVQRDARGLLPHHGLKMVLGAHWTGPLMYTCHLGHPRRALKVVWACLPREERAVSAWRSINVTRTIHGDHPTGSFPWLPLDKPSPLDKRGKDSPWLRQVREQGEGTVVSLTVNKFYQNSSWRTPYKQAGPHSRHSFQSDNGLRGKDAPWSVPLFLYETECEHKKKISSWPQGGTGSTWTPYVILATQDAHWWKGGLPDGQLIEGRPTNKWTLSQGQAAPSFLEGMEKSPLHLSAEDPGDFPPPCRIAFLGTNGTKPPFFGWTNEGESSVSTVCVEGTKENPPHFSGGTGGR